MLAVNESTAAPPGTHAAYATVVAVDAALALLVVGLNGLLKLLRNEPGGNAGRFLFTGVANDVVVAVFEVSTDDVEFADAKMDSINTGASTESVPMRHINVTAGV